MIVPIFKNGDKNNPSNYRTIMIIPLLSKLYEIILEKNVNIWLEILVKKVKGHAVVIRYHSAMDHLVRPRTIVEKCCNNKINLMCCFVEFKRTFNVTMPRTNL